MNQTMTLLVDVSRERRPVSSRSGLRIFDSLPDKHESEGLRVANLVALQEAIAEMEALKTEIFGHWPVLDPAAGRRTRLADARSETLSLDEVF